jgi:hypothetical protein
MKRIASRAALVAAFPSVDPRRLSLARKAWRCEPAELAALVLKHAPRTHAWMRFCLNPPSRMQVRRRACDELIDNHGVEFLGEHRRTGAGVYYSNAGDTYAATLIFHGNNAYLGCWGDIVERNAVKERERM